MPIEVEDKFVLQNVAHIEPFLLTNVKKKKLTIYQIQQAYIGSEGRIRKRVKTFHRGYSLQSPITEYFFTYKRKLKGRKGALELEMKISKHDFELAWSEEKTIELNKTRICIYTQPDEMWEIDFFKSNDETYFILAECELPSNKHKHRSMPDIVKDNLLYTVPDNDPRFKNRELSDPIKTKKLLYNIITEQTSGKIN